MLEKTMIWEKCQEVFSKKILVRVVVPGNSLAGWLFYRN